MGGRFPSRFVGGTATDTRIRHRKREQDGFFSVPWRVRDPSVHAHPLVRCEGRPADTQGFLRWRVGVALAVAGVVVLLVVCFGEVFVLLLPCFLRPTSYHVLRAEKEGRPNRGLDAPVPRSCLEKVFEPTKIISESSVKTI